MRALFILFIIAATGCGATPRHPLFGSSSSAPSRAPAGSPPQAPPPQGPRPIALEPTPTPLRGDAAAVESPSATREEIEALIARLRAGRVGERKAVLDRLVALGATPELQRALEDTAFESDVLEEALRLIRERAAGHDGSPETRIVITRRKAVASPWVEAKYHLALDKFLAGDELGAQGLVDAILTVEPDTAARPQLERLRRQIREQLIAETVISSTIVPEERVLAPDAPLKAKIVLENRTREDVTLKAAPGSPLGQVVLDYEELQPDGTRALRRLARPVKAGENGIKLASGAKTEIELDLPSLHGGKAKGLVGRYRLSGRLRPNTLLAGEESLPYFLPLARVEVIVLDADEKAGVEKPAEAFARGVKEARRALEARSEADLERAQRAIFAAALVWATTERDAAIAALVAELERSEGSLERTVSAALARATGEPGSFTKEEWLAWWKSGRSRPRARGAADPDEELDGSR